MFNIFAKLKTYITLSKSACRYKKNYGDITDNPRPKFWRGFKFWDKKNEIAVYKKMDFHGILDEVLYISNKKYNETFTMYESGEGEPEDKND